MPNSDVSAEVGVFGGSGLYSLLDDVIEVEVDTPYGPPSDKFMVASIAGHRVAFLPRHGRKHTIPPHLINYRANIWAMRELGVKHIIGPCAAGSLQPDVKPGDFVVCNQFVNRTQGRLDTYYDGPTVVHTSFAEPYCPQLRDICIKAAGDMGIRCHDSGTVVVIQGPRFSTKAESREYSEHGWQVINMTQYPECALAKELKLCYVNISLITDYDAGLEGRPDIEAVTHEAVLEVFNNNLERVKSLLFRIIADLPSERKCCCDGK